MAKHTQIIRRQIANQDTKLFLKTILIFVYFLQINLVLIFTYFGHILHDGPKSDTNEYLTH